MSKGFNKSAKSSDQEHSDDDSDRDSNSDRSGRNSYWIKQDAKHSDGVQGIREPHDPVGAAYRFKSERSQNVAAQQNEESKGEVIRRYFSDDPGYRNDPSPRSVPESESAQSHDSQSAKGAANQFVDSVSMKFVKAPQRLQEQVRRSQM